MNFVSVEEFQENFAILIDVIDSTGAVRGELIELPSEEEIYDMT